MNNGATARRTQAQRSPYQQGYGAGEGRSAGTALEAAAVVVRRARWGTGPVTLRTSVDEKGGARRPSLAKMRRRAVWSSHGGERRCPPGCGSLIGKPPSYCSANARDTSVGGSGRVRSLKGRPGHQRCARSPVRRPASSRLAWAANRASRPLAPMAGSSAAKSVTGVSGAHVRKEILAVAVSMSGIWANRSACSPASTPAAQTSRSARISPSRKPCSMGM